MKSTNTNQQPFGSLPQSSSETFPRSFLEPYARPGDRGQQNQQVSNGPAVINGLSLNHPHEQRPRPRGQPRWNNVSGVYTSAERRLPFVHRFRGFPPHSGSVQQPRRPPTKPKVSMSTYETNPVGALQERFQGEGIAPTFEIIQSEGASHCPTFTYQVHVGEITATGSGSSKKQAKHAAARALIDKIDGREPSVVVLPVAPTPVVPKVEEGVQAAKDPKENSKEQVGNPIGELQEFCVKNGLPMPIYDLGSVEGQPHRRSFLMFAKVGVLSVPGQGTSKKDAKKLAATGMLEKLVGAGTGAHSLVFAVVLPDVSRSNGSDNLDEEMSNLKIDTPTPKHNKIIAQFYKDLDLQAPKLSNLQKSALKTRNSNYVSLLGALGQEQNFEVTYVDIDEKTANGEAQCLVQLSTLPVAVCYGVGPDQASANQESARNALNYLKVMTKKRENPPNVDTKKTDIVENTKPRQGTQNGSKK